MMYACLCLVENYRENVGGGTGRLGACALCSDSRAGVQWTVGTPVNVNEIRMNYTCYDAQGNVSLITQT